MVARRLRRAALQPDRPSVCKSLQTQQTCISLAGRRASHSAIISAHRAFVPAARLCGCRGCPAPAPRTRQMAGLGSNMEVCLNVAEPQMDIFSFFPGVGSRREGISAGLPSIHALGKYLLSAYYVLSHPRSEEELHKGRTWGGCYTRRKKKTKIWEGAINIHNCSIYSCQGGFSSWGPFPSPPPTAPPPAWPHVPTLYQATSSFYPKLCAVSKPS